MLTPKDLRELAKEAALEAAKGVREHALEELRKTRGYRAMHEASEVYHKGARRYIADTVRRSKIGPIIDVIDRRKRDTPENVLNSMLGGVGRPGADFAEDVVRYARGGILGTSLANTLRNLGAVGTAIKDLLKGREPSSPDSAIRDAINLLTKAGFEVRQPPKPGNATSRTTPPPIPPRGSRIPPRIPGTPPPLPPSRTPPPLPKRGGRGPGEPPGGDEGGGRRLPVGTFPAGQAIEMQLVEGSSNVYAIGYQAGARTMRVQYLGSVLNRDAITGRGHSGPRRARGQLGRTHRGERRGPGATYDYRNVPPSVFQRISDASSKGTAIWDNLRVRGTVYGHQYSYELVAASRADVVYTDGKLAGRITYVPRRAVGPGAFIGRTIRQGTGRAAQNFRSILPNQVGRQNQVGRRGGP